MTDPGIAVMIGRRIVRLKGAAGEGNRGMGMIRGTGPGAGRRQRSSWLWRPVVVAACFIAMVVTGGVANAALPAGLNDSVVFSGLALPTSIRFAPDGKVFVAQKGGQIYVYDSVTDTTPSLVADLSPSVHDYWDRGLLGIAVDPGWPVSPYLYALYTVDARVGVTSGTGSPWGDGCPNPPGGDIDGCTVQSRLVRLTVTGSPLAVTFTKTLIDNEWCTQFQTHAVGDLHFGPDGALYASGGDGAEYHGVDYGQLGGSAGSPTRKNPCGDPPGGLGSGLTPPSAEGGALRSQSLRRPVGEPRLLNGTVIRVDPATGDALPDNPLASATSANERRVIASGLRNPFRFAFRPDPAHPGQLLPELWVGDVGWAQREEVNRIANPLTAVPNFGWPCYEGTGLQAEYQGLGLTMCNQLISSGSAAQPYFTYQHDQPVAAGDTCTGNANNTPFGSGGGSVTAVAFYQGTSYPSKYNNALLFADYSRNCIWAMLPGTNGVPDPTKVETFETGASSPVALEPGPGGDIYYVDIVGGEVHRISGSAPAAVATATTPTYGPLNLTVSFDGTQSSSPAGHALTYAWDLDGNGTYTDSTSATPTKTYTSGGAFDVRLRVKDTVTNVTATSAPIRVVPGGSAPTITSFSPQSTLSWKVGDTVPFAATVTDTEDGNLSGSALSWSIEVKHCNLANTACHSHFLGNATGTSGSFVAPDHEYPSHLEIVLTATDSSGLKTTKTVSVDPQLVTFEMRSNPSGAQLTIGSNTLATPFDISTIVGSSNSLNAPSPQAVGGSGYTFVSWSDDGAQSHAVTAGASTATYTATFAGGGDLALGKVASASSVEPPDQYNGFGVFSAARAVDGDGSTRWSSSYADNQWWQVDLGSAVSVSSVSVVWEAAYASSYKIQVSTDGVSFTDVATVTGTGAGVKSTSFAAVSARYVRVLGLTRATPYGFSFFTVQVFGGGGGGGVPVNSVLPVVSGSAVQGQTLSASTGTWSNAPTSYAYQWRRCDSAGANCANVGSGASSYVLAAGDVGSTVRVVVTASNGSGPGAPATSAQTGVVTASGGGGDLALGKVASASSVEPPDQYNGFGVFSAARAVDGDGSTRWSSSYADNQWWQVDLGSAVSVSSVSVVWEAAYASSYKIQVSTDGVSFTDVATVTGTGAGVKSTSFAAVSARYVRVLGLTRATPYGFSFFTVQVFGGGGGGGVPVNSVLPVVSGSAVQGQTLSASTGTWSNAPTSYAYQWRRCDSAGANCANVGSGASSYVLAAGDVGSTVRVVVTASNGSGPGAPATSAQTGVVTASGGGGDLALGKVASASSVEPPDQYNGFGVFSAARAVDGDGSTRWSSSYADNQWWQVDLGSAVSVSSVSVVWEAAYASSYKIQVSTDGVSFTDVATVTGTGAGVKSTSFAAVSARYVRVLGLTRATPYGFSFFTVQVFGGGGGGGVPVNSVLPVVSGSAVQGQTLSASTGTWSNAPTSYAYQWRRCDSAGANCANVGSGASSYVLAAGDVGSTVRVVVTASNGSGPGAPATSAQTGVVTASGGGGDLALGKVASASSVEPPDQYNGFGVFSAARAVDGDGSTRWSSSYADNQWWQVDLGSAVSVSSVSVVWEAAYASSYKIQVSTDGVSFTDVATVTGTGAGVKSTSFAAVSARYVRVLGLTRATPYGFSFFTVQVFGP